MKHHLFLISVTTLVVSISHTPGSVSLKTVLHLAEPIKHEGTNLQGAEGLIKGNRGDGADDDRFSVPTQGVLQNAG